MIGEHVMKKLSGEGDEMVSLKEIPSFDLQRHHAKVQLPDNIDLREIARKCHVFPLKLVSWQGEDFLLLAMLNPKDQLTIAKVEEKTQMKVLPVQAEALDIQWLIQKYYYGMQNTPRPSFRPKELAHQLFESLLGQVDASKMELQHRQS